ncbi:MAG: transporter substrate-binding domain-containing protein [Desulfobacteraceae bacterium]|nr:transporter substrate-binding domain-containing protein [Desulfobacteraceae bacterium]
MRRNIIILLVITGLFIPPAWADQTVLRVGTDQNFWYPFTYTDQGKASGIHIDIAAQALKNLGFRAEFIPLPWKRCLEQMRQGKLDAVVSASYKPDRAPYLFYPADAASTDESKWRITQVAYVVITGIDDPYEYTGDVQSLPLPVRAPLGYSIVDDLKAQGVTVLTAPDTQLCMSQLIRSGRGTVITPPQNADRFNTDGNFTGKIKIHSQPISSKSYFMVFAKKNQKLDENTITSIWTEIARLRRDKSYMAALFGRYAGNTGKEPVEIVK